MVKGILWDNDGVLVDTEHLFYAANREILASHGVDLTPRQFLDWFLLDNCGAWHLLLEKGYQQQDIIRLRGERNALQTQLLANFKASQPSLAFAGMEALLADLAQRDLAMGVVTSALEEHFHLIHTGLNFLPHLQFILTDGSYTNSKPAPDPYLLGLQRLALPAEACVVVEDSPRGLLSARAAGIRCIVLRNELSLDYGFPGAYRVVDSVPALRDELVSLLA